MIGHGMDRISTRTMHQTVKASLVPNMAYLVTQMRNRLACSAVIATMKIQLLERAMPPSAGIFGVEQAAVVLDVAAASRQPLGLVRRVD